jgi:hypothetical protein
MIASATGATFRLAPRLTRHQGVLEVMDAAGEITQVRISPADMRRLAAALMKVAGALESANASDDTTQP